MVSDAEHFLREDYHSPTPKATGYVTGRRMMRLPVTYPVAFGVGCIMHKEVMNRLNSRTFAERWSVPGGLDSIQNFPKHVVQYLSTYHGARSLFYRDWDISYNQSSEKWRSRFNKADVHSLFLVWSVEIKG